jgi:hypothetical protein
MSTETDRKQSQYIRYNLPVELQAMGQRSPLLCSCVQSGEMNGLPYEQMLEKAVILLCKDNERQLKEIFEQHAMRTTPMTVVVEESKNSVELAQSIMGIKQQRRRPVDPTNTDFRDRPSESQSEYFGKP